MGKVIIIKNNSISNEIHRYANMSLQQGAQQYYYSMDQTTNEECIKEIKKQEIDREDIILLISYKEGDQKEIEDMFIGTDVSINDKNNIYYLMKVLLKHDYNERAIQSIVEKIDLDLTVDFEMGRYAMLSEMENLYQELHERIIASCAEPQLSKKEGRVSTETAYQLDALAQRNEQSIRVYQNDVLDDSRTEFQRDRERIVNCEAFRRMVDKAQIFSADKGDYYRTRMTHTLEVNQIAKAIAYALNLNLDLTEAIALGHDLGHTPFGHQGERTLDAILHGKIDVGIVASEKLFENSCFGGFKHNYQSAKILTSLEEKYKEFPGLNVSVQVVEGVLKHTKLNPKDVHMCDFLTAEYQEQINITDQEEQVCSTLEGQVVAVADEIAQRGHDVDDALTSGVMTINELLDRLKIKKCIDLKEKIEKEIESIEKSQRLTVDVEKLKIARIVSCIVQYFIQSTITYSRENIKNNQSRNGISLNNQTIMVSFSPEVKKVNSYLEKVIQKKVICNHEVARADYNAGVIIQTLFRKYYENPRLLHSGTVHKIFLETLKHPDKYVSNSAINLSDASVKLANAEIEEMTTATLKNEITPDYLVHVDKECKDQKYIIFEKRKILIRAIVDFIAGMTDGYAMEEYERLKN